MSHRLLSLLFLVAVLPAFGQQHADTPAAGEPKTSYATAGLNYLTDYVYLGRADSLRLPYLSPVVGYYHKSGLYAEASASWLLRSDSGRLDMGTLRGGYLYEGEKISAGIAAEKYFYNQSSTNIRAEITGGLDGQLGYTVKGFTAEMLTGLSLGSKTDLWLSLGVKYEFQADSGLFKCTPGIQANGSTRNFYGSYYGKRRLKNSNVLAQVSAEVQDAAQFKPMSYEFSLPLEYTLGRVTIALSPVYSVAVNPAVTTVTIKPPVAPAFTRVVNEKLKNRFYASLDLYYTF